MTDSAAARPRLDLLDRAPLVRAADALAVAVAVSLPWSTSATGILVVIWFIVLLPTLDGAALRREILSPAGGSPLVLLGLAVLGMSWADVGWSERFQGLSGFLKLLFIPFLLAQFHRSARGWWVVVGFFAASLALLVVSWALTLFPELPWHSKMPGVPVKDYISQSSIFSLCTFALLGHAAELWRARRLRLALAALILAAVFVANIAYVETSRTTLVTMTVVLLLFGFRQFGWKGIVAAGVAGAVLAATLWISSPYLRQRVMDVVDEVNAYHQEHAATSSGLRLEYWKDAVQAVATSPLVGHGTGTIPELLRSTASPGRPDTFGTVNPHNQILVVAIQLGLVGTIALLAMWLAHLALFRRDGLVCWIGLVAVVQNIIGSLFNSHLSDFTHGWIYVFAVGVLGGMALRRSEGPETAAGRDTPNGAR
jgi:O-antigen ligase